MLTTLLIGLGGAMGSIARAWLGTAIASLTGAAFPWGTIAVNVAGSFLIGFFGTLTVTDGRFAVAPDWRAFVMIGFCGGFTTFSSFSLQTLELIRDQRPMQALLNIGLSVGICLASVAAGYAVALSVRTSHLAAAGPSPDGTLGGSMVVALHRPERVADMLSTAARLLALGEGRSVTALAIDEPVLAPLLPTAEVTTQERKRTGADRADWARSLRDTLDQWTQDERNLGFEAHWIEVGGDAARAVTEHGRDAHLLLLEQQPGDRGLRERAHAAMIGAARPVLLVPPGGGNIDSGGTVAVAWNDDPHVRRAVRTAWPLLARAGRIVVIRIDAPPDATVPDIFADLPAELLTAGSQGETVGARLLACAHDAGAGLLVMGSYGRGRFRDRLLDGVTETVIANADLPVLAQHQA